MQHRMQSMWAQRRCVGPVAQPKRCVSLKASPGDLCAAPAVQSQRQQVVKQPLPQLAPLDDKYEATHAFSAYANWLVPGAIMLGRYPFVEPSRCRSRELGELQLTEILEAGVTTFVCLQEELPSQEELRLVGKNGFMPYKSTAELIQRALNGPPPSSIVNGLRNPTLNQFLPTKKPQVAPGQEWNPKQLHFLHHPIVDLGTPCPDALSLLLDEIQVRLERGEVVYAHCWGGRGRAGTLGACLLAAAWGVGADEALERVQRAFDTRRDGGRKSPETDEQYEFVREYIASRTAGGASQN